MRHLLLLAIALLTAAPAGAKPITVGYLTGGASPFGAVAKAQGIFSKEKLDVELVPFASSPDALNALNSGKLDIAAGFGTAPPLIFISKGADFVVIAGHMTGGHAIVGTPEFAAKYKSVRDLKGRTVVSPRLITPDVILKGALVKAGLTFGPNSGQVKIIEVKNGPQALAVLKSGKVDAAALVHTEVVLARDAGYKILAWSTDLFPEHPCCRVVVRRDFLKTNPKKLTAFLRAWIRAERVRQDNPNAYIDAYAKQGSFSFAKAKSILYEPHVSHSADPNTLAVVKMWNYLRIVGYIQSDKNIRNYIDPRFYKKALDSLAAENPKDGFYQKLERRFKQQNPDYKAASPTHVRPGPRPTARTDYLPGCCAVASANR